MSDPQREVLLEFDEVGFSFDDQDFTGASHPVLAGVDLLLRRGDFLAVLGPQSAGASTLCRLAAGLLTVEGQTTGQITRGGSVAMLGDDPEAQLSGMTSFAADEIRLPARLHGIELQEADGRAEQAARALGITHLGARRLETLSGGERQLTALASLMALQPDLLILDQPALALDAPARSRLVQALQEHCAAGGAVLVTSHQYDDVAAAADEFLTIDQGVTSANFPVESLPQHGVWQPRAGVAGTPSTADPESSEGSGAFPGAAAGSPVLEVADLTVSFSGRRVLDAAQLSLSPGETVAVLGPNGSGKSTLLRTIAGLHRAPNARGWFRSRRGRSSGSAVEVSGSIRLTGQEISELPAHHRVPQLAWVGQDPGVQLSAPTVVKELQRALVEEPSPKQVEEVLAITGLTGLETEHPYDLSPSQRKDLVIATALLLQPAVLLLDEPTLGRDASAMDQLNRMVDSFTGAGGAVLLTTHDHVWAGHIAQKVQAIDITSTN